MQRFKNKSVIVTGAGSGIGRATAIAFAQEGAQVIVADMTEATGNETVDMIRAANGVAQFIAFDAGDVASVNRLVEQGVAAFGKLDVLFANAGISDRFVPATQTDDELWQRVIGVDLSGVFYCMRAALPHLTATRGNIVVTGSIASLRGMAGGPAYTAAKHGVLGLINQVAAECGALGVRVNGVAPGPIRTNIVPEMADDPKIDQWIAGVTALGRWGQPEEIARPVLFLASEDASFVTGTLLRVDGGWGSK